MGTRIFNIRIGERSRIQKRYRSASSNGGSVEWIFGWKIVTREEYVIWILIMNNININILLRQTSLFWRVLSSVLPFGWSSVENMMSFAQSCNSSSPSLTSPEHGIFLLLSVVPCSTQSCRFLPHTVGCLTIFFGKDSDFCFLVPLASQLTAVCLPYFAGGWSWSLIFGGENGQLV